MKKLSTILVTIHLILAANCTIAQWQTYQTPSNSFFYDVAVLNQNIIWACGSGGIVVKTTNGGSNWVVANSGLTGLSCYLISAIDENNAWVTAGANNNRIFRTTNGGLNWTEQFYGNPAWIDGMIFLVILQVHFYRDPEQIMILLISTLPETVV